MIVMTTSDALQSLDRELREIFGPRLQSLVAYGSLESRHSVDGRSHGHGPSAPTRTLAIVDAMTREDLRACATRVDGWHMRGLATPLLVAAHEFDRSLDVRTAGDSGAAARHAERMLGVPPGAIADIVKLAGGPELPTGDAERLFSPYLDAAERLVNYVDGWIDAR